MRGWTGRATSVKRFPGGHHARSASRSFTRSSYSFEGVSSEVQPLRPVTHEAERPTFPMRYGRVPQHY